MVALDWEKVPGGKGYRTIEQGKAFRKRLEQDCKIYLYACYLYYHGPPDTESPLTDDAFDRIQNTLEHYRIETPEWFQKRTKAGSLKTDAHSLHYTEQEKREALAWAASWMDKRDRGKRTL